MINVLERKIFNIKNDYEIIKFKIFYINVLL